MKIIYFSQTGNTEKMANLILEGIESEGKKAELVEVSNATLDDVNN
ncbi:flavodoxin family protein, partial [Clostridium beijerinckii]